LVRDGEFVETLKMRALPKGSYDYIALVGFLKLYRDAVQLAINMLWNLDEAPLIATLHRTFYSELRKYGFRANHVKQIYFYAKGLLEVSEETV